MNVKDYGGNPHAEIPPSGPPASAGTALRPEPVTSVNQLAAKASAQGATVYQFDADASPEEKAAQLAKAQPAPVDGSTIGRTNVGQGSLLRLCTL
jgi:hypothetical protein